MNLVGKRQICWLRCSFTTCSLVFPQELQKYSRFFTHDAWVVTASFPYKQFIQISWTDPHRARSYANVWAHHTEDFSSSFTLRSSRTASFPASGWNSFHTRKHSNILIFSGWYIDAYCKKAQCQHIGQHWVTTENSKNVLYTAKSAIVDFGAVQKLDSQAVQRCANLVDLEKSATSIFTCKKSASLQPRTNPEKFHVW